MKQTHGNLKNISPPPEYMPEKNGKHHKFIPKKGGVVTGFWDGDKGDKGAKFYLPIVSKKTWKDKEKFLIATWNIERYLSSVNDRKYYVEYSRGMAPSRLEDNVSVGNGDYHDTEWNALWPTGFVPHYIGKWNVMPTKAFFEYVMCRISTPFPGMEWVEPTFPKLPPCPPDKIFNPQTYRCVLKTGKVGRQVMKQMTDDLDKHPIWAHYVEKRWNRVYAR